MSERVIPGADQLRTATARYLVERPRFAAVRSRAAGVGDHIAVNGHDLAAVEREAFRLGAKWALENAYPGSQAEIEAELDRLGEAKP